MMVGMTAPQTPNPAPSADAPAAVPRAATRVRASELVGRGWLNTGGEQVSLEDLRGKVVLLDFWTFCCINCLHVLDELRPLEEEFADVLVTVGVHSPKFEHEADPDALAAAVERYAIEHPVLDDPELTTWQAYSARAWPTLVVVDPEGYIAAHLSGEGHVAGLYGLVRELVAEHEAKGTLHRGSGPYVPPAPVARDLSFPGKAVSLGGRGSRPGSFLVSDTGHHRLLEVAEDLTTVLRAFGGGDPATADAGQAELAFPTPGEKGHADGGPDQALFNEPQGLALLPEDVAQRVGYDVVVADSVNHRLRGLRLSDGHVSTLAGNGVQKLIDSERAKEAAAVDDEGDVAVDLADLPGEPTAISLSSPWDVVWHPALGRVVIAMAGFGVEEFGNAWATLFLITERGLDPAAAVLGASTLLGAQFVGRLAGDRTLAALGRRGALTAGLGAVVVGLGLALAPLPGPVAVPAAFAGLVLAGLGCAVVVPVAYALGDEAPGLRPQTGLAVTSWCMRLAGVGLSPAVGALAGAVGLAPALTVFLGLAVVGAVLAARLPATP